LAFATAKGIGRIRLTRVADASAKSLEPAIAAAIEIVRSSAEVGENLLPLANRVASLLKRWLLGTHQGAVSVAHIDYYLGVHFPLQPPPIRIARPTVPAADPASCRSQPRPSQRNPRRPAAHGKSTN
jgi:hypothetical protein